MELTIKNKKYFIIFRPFEFFFKKNWYGNRLKLEINKSSLAYCKYIQIIDIGAISIGIKEE